MLTPEVGLRQLHQIVRRFFHKLLDEIRGSGRISSVFPVEERASRPDPPDGGTDGQSPVLSLLRPRPDSRAGAVAVPEPQDGQQVVALPRTY
jgi:hypothetical protein